LPENVDVTKIAAAMNPAMSAWVALRRRVPLQPGHGLGTDRRHGRPHHRAAVGGTPIGQPPAPGQRAGRRAGPGLPGRTAVSVLIP
jgi:hypothetical protein